MVNHSHIVSIFLAYLFQFSQSRVVPEKVPGLSENSEAEFIPGALGTISCTTLTVRLSVLSNYPLRTLGGTICESVCLSLDVSDLIIISHEIRLYFEKTAVVYVSYVTGLVLLKTLAIRVDNYRL